MNLLPEAFESQAGAKELIATLLAGLVFFFLLDKSELWQHGDGGHVHDHPAPQEANESHGGQSHPHASDPKSGD